MASVIPGTLVSRDESATIPSLIISNFFNGATPGFIKLDDLSTHAQDQYAFYAAVGIGLPLLGPYEALGRGFAETEAFKTKYGALSTEFVAKTYLEVFGQAPNAEQQAHFDAQISYFVSIYTAAGLSIENAGLFAKGAVMGQMLGHAALGGGSVFNYHAAAENYIAQMDKAGFVPGRPLADFAASGAGGGGTGNPAPTGLAFVADTMVAGQAVILDGRAGSALGTISASDPGDTLTFSVDDVRFEVVGGTLKLKAGQSISLEDQQQVPVTIKVVDSAGGSASLGVNFDVRPVEAGTGVDGYIKGATVFRDANGDGVQDIGETWDVTDDYGNFQMVSGPGRIILTGGVDLSTGAAFTGRLVAPEGSSVVTPLTDLVATLQQAMPNLTLQAANDKVIVALGLTPGVDIQALDPIYFTLSSDPVERAAGKQALAAAVALQNTIVQAAAVFQGAGATAADIQAAQDIVAATIAAKINALAGAPIDLKDMTVLAAIVDGATTSAGAVPDPVVSAAAQSVIAASNTATATALLNAFNPATAITLLQDLAKIAIVAQGDATVAIVAAAELGDVGNTAAFTGTNLDGQIAAIQTSALPTGILGLNGSDTLDGGAGNDIIYGYGGDDTLNGNDGDDRLIGGYGSDHLNGGSGDDWLNGGRGNDTINGGLGTDSAYYDKDFENGGTAGIIVDLRVGTLDDDLGTATDGYGDTDSLISVEEGRGTRENDFFYGDNKDNFFRGLDGNDTMTGAAGFDTMRPGAGTDSFDGGSVANPNDFAEVDSLDYADAPAALVAALGAGGSGSLTDPWGHTDSYTNLEGLNGTQFADTLTGNEQNNRFRGQAGADTIDGAAGIDTIDYRREVNFGGTSGVSVNLSLGTATDGFGTQDTLISIENARGSPFNDILVGSVLANDIRGDAGNDLTDGLGVSQIGTFDVLYGQGGDDTFVYKVGYGSTVIADLTAGAGSVDKIDLRSFGFATYQDVASRMSPAGPNVQISFGNGDVLTLWTLTMGQLSADDFLL
jgi:hypothetical protein